MWALLGNHNSISSLQTLVPFSKRHGGRGFPGPFQLLSPPASLPPALEGGLTFGPGPAAIRYHAICAIIAGAVAIGWLDATWFAWALRWPLYSLHNSARPSSGHYTTYMSDLVPHSLWHFASLFSGRKSRKGRKANSQCGVVIKVSGWDLGGMWNDIV